MKSSSRALIAILLVSFLIGCIQEPIEEWEGLASKDLLGDWSSEEGTVLSFREDMTFKVDNVEAGWRSELREGAGTWALVEPTEQIYLKYDEKIDFSVLISSMNDDGDLKLYLLQGDPDLGLRLVLTR